jgi:hypothetical protein
MAQKALSQGGGEARILAARFPTEQASRVLEMANAAGLTRSEFVRQAVSRALDQGEQEGRSPPGEGS